MSKYEYFTAIQLKKEYDRIERELLKDPLNVKEIENKKELYPFIKHFPLWN